MTPKALTDTLTTIKRDLAHGRTESLTAVLESAGSPDLLRALREQKILFRVQSSPERAIAASLLRALARRVLPPPTSVLYENYIELVLLAIQIRARLTASVKEMLQAFPRISYEGLLLIAEECQDMRLAVATTSPAPLPDDTSLQEKVSAAERYLHEQNATSNGVFFAVVRALNEASRHVRSEGPDEDAALLTAAELFDPLVDLALEWNCLEHMIDSVTFGDWSVREVDPRPGGRGVKLEFVDPKLSLYRRLSMRRRVAQSHVRVRAPRNVKDYLSPVMMLLVPQVIAYYETLCGCPQMTLDDHKLCVNAVLPLLEHLDLDDDLLFAMAHYFQEISAHYVAAAGLISCAQIVRVMTAGLPERFGDRLSAARIPFDLIAGLAPEGRGQLAIKQALRRLCTALPTTRHFNLVRMPFVKIGEESAQPLGIRYFNNWNTAVRSAVIDGGSLGRSLGAVWEEYLAGKLQRGGWSVIGRNIRLKVKGSVATDIDIALRRDDILLLAQVKAITGAGCDTYDHWKNRNIIEKGCHQARLAADILRDQPQRLMSLTNRKVASRIRYIEPVVLTNCLELDHWEHEGVAVLGPAGTSALAEGSCVVSLVHTETGRVLESRQLNPPGQTFSESILWILRNPPEQLVCPEDGRIDSVTAEFQGMRWQIPTFAGAG